VAVIKPSERPVRATAAGPVGTPVVVGLDLGTTSAKAVAVDAELRVWASTARAYPLHAPRPGWAEQTPDDVTGAALRAMHDTMAAAREHGADVRGVSISAAMHSVLGVAADGRPVTPALTYADSRAREQAAELRGTPKGIAVYERTGVPMHPMTPLLKLRWFGLHEPELLRSTARWISLKEYLLSRMGADVVVDHSLASGTGMFDLRERRWNDEALALAGVSEAQLSPLVAPTTVLQADDVDVPVIVGGGDGALANVGAGALRPGVAALSIGTSGAIRVVARRPVTDVESRLFCNALSDDMWVVGGAISNGGIVLRWLRDRLFSRDGMQPITYEQLTAMADAVPPGCEGLLFLPYLAAERAPRWDPSPRGALLGLDLRHGPGHIIRAGMEGVSMQLRWVADAMGESGCDVDSVRATGGFTASPVWVQILADVLGREVHVPDESEGSSVGAALLGMVALGLVESLEAGSARVRPGRVVRPRSDCAAMYDKVYKAFRDAQPILGPAMAVLGELRASVDEQNAERPQIS
jgi:gluconokinase